MKNVQLLVVLLILLTKSPQKLLFLTLIWKNPSREINYLSN